MCAGVWPARHAEHVRVVADIDVQVWAEVLLEVVDRMQDAAILCRCMLVGVDDPADAVGQEER